MGWSIQQDGLSMFVLLEQERKVRAGEETVTERKKGRGGEGKARKGARRG